MAYEEDFEDSSYQPAQQNSSQDQSWDQSPSYNQSQPEAIPTYDNNDSGGASEQPTDWGVPDDYGPVQEESVEQEEESSGPQDWVRQLLDYTREMFGLGEEAIPGDEPTGLPQQAPGEEPAPTRPQEDHEPAGDLPRQAAEDDAAFDRKVGTAGGVRSGDGPEPTKLDPAGSEQFKREPGAALDSQLGTLKDVGQRMFGAKEPPPTDTTKRVLDYVMGRGAETNDQRKQREAQVAANTDPNQPMTKSQIREASLKAAFQQSPEAGAAALQNHRQNQQTYRGMAAAALDNGDREGAAKLFNESHTFVPDGQHAAVTPTANGVQVTTQGANGETKSTMLSDPQFRELLQKTPGEMDHLTERGLQNMLADVARSPGTPAPGQPGGAAGQGVSNLPQGAAIPGQAGPTSSTGRPDPMTGAGVANTPGANVPQVGRQAPAPAAAAPGNAPNAIGTDNKGNPIYGVAPPGGVPPPAAAAPRQPGQSQVYDRNAQVNAATAIGGKPAMAARGKDPDGWPTGIPRGGQFANTNSANRDYSTPISFGKSGHIGSIGKNGSAPVYDARGHTYNVGKDGLPVAREGQPGWRPPAQGQPNWRGTDNPQINTRQSGDYRPRVLNNTPSSRADARSEDRRYTADQRSQNQEANRNLKQAQGDRSNEIKQQAEDRRKQQGDRKGDQTDTRLGQGQQSEDRKARQGDRRGDQTDTRLQDQRDRVSQQAADKAADRVQRMNATELNDATHALNARIKDGGFKKLGDDDKALYYQLQDRASAGMKERSAAPSGGGSSLNAGGGGTPTQTAVDGQGNRVGLIGGKWVPIK